MEKDNFALRIQEYFIDKGWENVNAMMITLIGSVFIFSMFLTFILGGGSYLLGLEGAEETVKLTFIVSSFLFFLTLGMFIINLFNKGEKNGN